MLSKKHFTALASIFYAHRPLPDPNGESEETWIALRDEIADLCAKSNPNFDRERFLAACERTDAKTAR